MVYAKTRVLVPLYDRIWLQRQLFKAPYYFDNSDDRIYAIDRIVVYEDTIFDNFCNPDMRSFLYFLRIQRVCCD